jgi:hypothetical protein
MPERNIQHEQTKEERYASMDMKKYQHILLPPFIANYDLQKKKLNHIFVSSMTTCSHLTNELEISQKKRHTEHYTEIM